MGGHCTRTGAHACADAASHRDGWPWLRGVAYTAHIADPPSPSALPLRHEAVMEVAAALRGLSPEAMHAEADRRHAALWTAFQQEKGEAMDALPTAERGPAAAQGRLAGRLRRDGLLAAANAAYRREYAALGLERAARGLEEVTAGYTAAIDERLRGGLLRGGRLRLFRLAEGLEADSVARAGVLRHHAGLDHLSFSLHQVKKYRGRPVLLVLGLTGNVMARLRALAYLSLAFAAPGSCPAFPEAWAGAKSWTWAGECEVRLHAPVPVRGLDLSVHMRERPGARAWRDLRRLCGRRKATVPGSWPPDL